MEGAGFRTGGGPSIISGRETKARRKKERDIDGRIEHINIAQMLSSVLPALVRAVCLPVEADK